jgi:hypothetical protein
MRPRRLSSRRLGTATTLAPSRRLSRPVGGAVLQNAALEHRGRDNRKVGIKAGCARRRAEFAICLSMQSRSASTALRRRFDARRPARSDRDVAIAEPVGAAADCESARQREVRRTGQIGGSRRPRSRTSFASTTVVTFFLSPPGYPGDLPCPAKGAAIKSHNDEDQSTLQRGTLGVRQEPYGKAELH